MKKTKKLSWTAKDLVTRDFPDGSRTVFHVKAGPMPGGTFFGPDRVKAAAKFIEELIAKYGEAK